MVGAFLKAPVWCSPTCFSVLISCKLIVGHTELVKLDQIQFFFSVRSVYKWYARYPKEIHDNQLFLYDISRHEVSMPGTITLLEVAK